MLARGACAASPRALALQLSAASPWSQAPSACFSVALTGGSALACKSPGPDETAPAGGPSTAPGAWQGLGTSREGGMSPLLRGGGQGGGCLRSTQPLRGNRKPLYEATPCGSYSWPGASLSPHAWHSGRSTAPHTRAGTGASSEAWLLQTRGCQFPPRRPTAGAGTRAVQAGGCSRVGCHCAGSRQASPPPPAFRTEPCRGVGSVSLLPPFPHFRAAPLVLPQGRGAAPGPGTGTEGQDPPYHLFCSVRAAPPFRGGQDPGSQLAAAQLPAP